jgi:hypothetical protein
MSSTNNPTPIASASQVELDAHTEQALVELIYVRTANDMIGSAMASLDQALNTTQSVLNILQALQNLHNQISVKSKSAFPFNFQFGTNDLTSELVTDFTAAGHHPGPFTVHSVKVDASGNTMGIDTYQKLYQKAASAYFGQAIDPFFVFTNANSSGFTDFVKTLTALKSSLLAEINLLTKLTPVDARDDPGSLLVTIKKVYDELPTNFSFASVEKWALDNYNMHGSTLAALGGGLQNSLTFAITAAENLNDTQKERVRRFLFIFQEYYQSASAVISAINQVATRMAQKISS